MASWTVRDNNAGLLSLGNNGGDDMESSIASNDGEWHHYAGTFSAFTGERDLYVDGVLAARETGNVPYYPAVTEHLVIGAKDSYSTTPPAYGNYFTGKIYDVRVYNYALTPSEVVTAENSDYVTPVLVTSEITLSTNSTAGKGYYGGKFVLTFNAKWLYGSTSIDGPWTVVATSSPYTNIMTNQQMFFRLDNP